MLDCRLRPYDLAKCEWLRLYVGRSAVALGVQCRLLLAVKIWQSGRRRVCKL